MNVLALRVFFLVLALSVTSVRSASFQTNSIEGWTTLVNERLWTEDNVATEGALELLRAQLKETMSNPMEYFAEATEAFFSRNDFFPFNRAELKRHDPEMEQLLAKLWGVKD